ncbi:MAG: tRNA uridine-5-carboxymethylaminomethyl(34) synthesis enzyme MnmG [Phycisphaerae bacterium]
MNDSTDYFEVLVIGGGHAGAEAAWAAAQMLGAGGGEGKVALVSMDPLAIGRMSCNPAIGGLAKGQIVREIDALGGLMGHAIDATGIQFRMLNRSKGPAVQSPRAQADKYRYAEAVQRLLKENCPNLTIVTGIVDRILTGEEEGSKGLRVLGSGVTGVVLEDGRAIGCRCVIVTTGTFLRGLMHCGPQKIEGGRIGEESARGLSKSLAELGLELGRLKTGTPPRLAAETIDFPGLAEQPGDEPPVPFSDLTGTADSPIAGFPMMRVGDGEKAFPRLTQVPMHITHTNSRVHELIRANLHLAPMYSGQIASRGPRYCPSIEDKVVRFADKEAHQIFLEPESLSTNEIYCNGISTSLPAEIQEQIVHSIAGLERAKILKYGYAVEYDFVPTHQIFATLETRRVAGLYLAGQINGTSGYEEAAGQGLIAGINAARRIQGREPIVLRRDQAYLGVMIDDLITKTPTEPYRMFTSRAEFRLMLRSDNTDQRLTPLGYEIGLATRARYDRLQAKLTALAEVTGVLKATKLPIGASGTTAYEYLRRPEVTVAAVRELIGSEGLRVLGSGGLGALGTGKITGNAEAVWVQAEIEAKYSGYIVRELAAAQRMRELEDKTIPAGFDFAALQELRKEARQALEKFRPTTVGQASRLEGITPNDLTVLLVYLRGKHRG